MKGRLLAIFLLYVLVAPLKVVADGTIIHPTAFAKVQIPDQRALIHFSNGVETLVIDTSFKGPGTNFAWIVPVPSVPEVEAATPGLFATLQLIFQPKVVHNVTKYFLAVLLFGAVVGLLIWNSKQGKPILDLLLCFLFLLILAGLLLPASGSARGTTTIGNVEIIDRKIVGAFETTTLSSPDGSALFAWLQNSGYATPTNLLPGIQAYAREGWCFVATKLKADAESPAPARAHPLLFRFKTDAPVYPLRLTGIGNTNCTIDLYVFGPGTAQTAGFRNVRCERPSYEGRNFWQLAPHPDFVRVRHPVLSKLVANSPVATKFTATLSNADMQKDAYITWIPYERVCPVYFSDEGAITFSINILASCLVTAGLIWLSMFHANGVWGYRVRRTCAWLGALCIVGSLVLYVMLPKTEVTLSQSPPSRMRATIWQVSTSLAEDWRAEKLKRGSDNGPSLDWVREGLAGVSAARRTFPATMRRNPFTGTGWKEEDSPGNYTLRMNGDLVEVVWYDFNGEEMVESPFEAKTTPKRVAGIPQHPFHLQGH